MAELKLSSLSNPGIALGSYWRGVLSNVAILFLCQCVFFSVSSLLLGIRPNIHKLNAYHPGVIQILFYLL